MTEFRGTDMVTEEQFKEFWELFTERYSESDQHMLVGYMCMRVGCAILEKAFDIDPVGVEVDNDD